MAYEKGHEVSVAARAATSQRKKGRRVTDVTRERNRQAQLGRPMDAATREKISLAKTGVPVISNKRIMVEARRLLTLKVQCWCAECGTTVESTLALAHLREALAVYDAAKLARLK